MNEWCFHGIELKTDNKKFIVFRPATLLANELWLPSNKIVLSLDTSEQTKRRTISRSSLSNPCRMAVGSRDTAFDLGIKQLLCNDNEDDESVWAYFSKFLEDKQPPLIFPIPPTLDIDAVTATPTTTNPTMSSTDNHYQLSVLSEVHVQNTKPLNDADIE